jgi:hypothetical protein
MENMRENVAPVVDEDLPALPTVAQWLPPCKCQNNIIATDQFVGHFL